MPRAEYTCMHCERDIILEYEEGDAPRMIEDQDCLNCLELLHPSRETESRYGVIYESADGEYRYETQLNMARRRRFLEEAQKKLERWVDY